MIEKATLVIMAAGIGSRFGGGIKQLESVGPNGEIIIDYSIRDALDAGFDNVVFVIRKEIEEDFKEIIGQRIEKLVKVQYAYQETKDISEEFRGKFEKRTKPWGTGQAILCCRDYVKTPFLVVNADDYYGKEAYREAYKYLTEQEKKSDKLSICMVGFVLKNTLSDNGGVTRGVCKVNQERMLTEIVETHNIIKTSEGAQSGEGNARIPLDINAEVSMNMWGFRPEFFKVLEKGFVEFLEQIGKDDEQSEYLLPTIIGNLLKKEQIEVKVLQSKDRWFGVTYKEDKETVVEAIRELIVAGYYN